MDGVCGLEIPLVVVNDELVEVNWGPADRNAKCTIVDVNVVDSWLGRVLRRSLGMKNRWSRRRLLEGRWKGRSIQWDWCWRWILDRELSVFLFVLDWSPVVVCLLFFVAIAIVGVHQVSFIVVSACAARVRGIDDQGIGLVRCQKGFCDVLRPALVFLWDLHASGDEITVAFPDKLENVCLVLTHSFPLGIKLEAVIVGMVAEQNVRVPCDGVSDGFVGLIVASFGGH